MLVQHVFQEFSSPSGHLRAKAAWVAGQYAQINFSDTNNFLKALQSVIAGIRDPELPVRVDSVFALRSFVEACKDLSEIRQILPQLLDEYFKLMNEVENEDLVFTLETIVERFGEEMAPYSIVERYRKLFISRAEANAAKDLRITYRPLLFRWGISKSRSQCCNGHWLLHSSSSISWKHDTRVVWDWKHSRSHISCYLVFVTMLAAPYLGWAVTLRV